MEKEKLIYTDRLFRWHFDLTANRKSRNSFMKLIPPTVSSSSDGGKKKTFPPEYMARKNSQLSWFLSVFESFAMMELIR